jgi:hypothetical protein
MIGRLLRILLTLVPMAPPLLSLAPRIRKDCGLLIAATGWRVRLLTLGMMLRQVIVDPKDETVIVRDRYLWLFPRTRTIRFRDIRAVTYGYDDWSWTIFGEPRHPVDCYPVGLCLGDDREISLFYFFGEREFADDGLPEWFLWPEYPLDLVGTQQSRSRLLVELLGKMIGVTVQPPRC